MDILSPDHFLSLPRPDVTFGPPAGVPDTTTLAAHDFDVDTRTGFMPPQPPLGRLPEQWEVWEATLDHAMCGKLQLGEKAEREAAALSESWRAHVRNVSLF
jgi:indoleamine 2,3-dioxygenase